MVFVMRMDVLMMINFAVSSSMIMTVRMSLMRLVIEVCSSRRLVQDDSPRHHDEHDAQDIEWLHFFRWYLLSWRQDSSDASNTPSFKLRFFLYVFCSNQSVSILLTGLNLCLPVFFTGDEEISGEFLLSNSLCQKEKKYINLLLLMDKKWEPADLFQVNFSSLAVQSVVSHFHFDLIHSQKLLDNILIFFYIKTYIDFSLHCTLSFFWVFSFHCDPSFVWHFKSSLWGLLLL